MTKRIYEDADGNPIEVDDEISLLGPQPKQSPDSSTNRQFEPIKSFHQPAPLREENWRTKKAPFPTGYGITQADIDEWKRNNGGKK